MEKSEKMPDAPSNPPAAPENDSSKITPEARVTNTGGEVTQTDRLNKQLLESLLDRLNGQDDALQRMMPSQQDQNDDDDWDTSK